MAVSLIQVEVEAMVNTVAEVSIVAEASIVEEAITRAQVSIAEEVKIVEEVKEVVTVEDVVASVQASKRKMKRPSGLSLPRTSNSTTKTLVIKDLLALLIPAATKVAA